MTPTKPTVVIVEDHPAVLVGLQALIRANKQLEILGVAHDGREALRTVAEMRPDVVSLDLHLPGSLDGFETCRQLVARDRPPGVVVYTAREDGGVIDRAHNAGAIGIVAKSESPHELIRALLLAARGRPYTSPRFVGAIAPPELSPRQQEVLGLIAEGLGNRAISERLGVSIETVRSHVKGLLQQLEASHRSHAVAIGLRNALID